MRDIYYPFSEDTVNNDPDLGKAKVVQSFFKYLNDKMKKTGAILSADLFGMASTNTDDLNIGQILYNRVENYIPSIRAMYASGRHQSLPKSNMLIYWRLEKWKQHLRERNGG